MDVNEALNEWRKLGTNMDRDEWTETRSARGALREHFGLLDWRTLSVEVLDEMVRREYASPGAGRAYGAKLILASPHR